MDSRDGNQVDLHRLAPQSMLAHGFQPDFGPAVLEELSELESAGVERGYIDFATANT